MKDSRQFKVYKTKFNLPCQTARGTWTEKESIILRKEDKKGNLSFGEVSLVKGFTSERLSELLPLAIHWRKDGKTSENSLFKSAVSCLESEIWNAPLGINSLNGIHSATLANFNTQRILSEVYKIKIGISDVVDEISRAKEFFKLLSSASRVRLDANESLNIEDLYKWNEEFKDEPKLEFLEQPLPRHNLEKLIEIQHRLDIPLAIDESIFWKGDFSYFMEDHWRGFFVIKPALMSNWSAAIEFIKSKPDRCVISTTFESPFGYEAVIRFASFSNCIAGLDRNIYYNIEGEFSAHHQNPLFPGTVNLNDLDNLWSSL